MTIAFTNAEARALLALVLDALERGEPGADVALSTAHAKLLCALPVIDAEKTPADALADRMEHVADVLDQVIDTLTDAADTAGISVRALTNMRADLGARRRR